MVLFIDDDFIKYAVTQYSGMITRIAYQYTRNKSDSEDIMQDVFFALIKQQSFKTEEHLKAWLIRVSINKCKDYLRASKHRKTVELNDEYNLIYNQKAVFDELQQLSDKERNILYLFYYEGYTAKEISGILKIKESAVFMRLNRARESLRFFLEE